MAPLILHPLNCSTILPLPQVLILVRDTRKQFRNHANGVPTQTLRLKGEERTDDKGIYGSDGLRYR